MVSLKKSRIKNTFGTAECDAWQLSKGSITVTLTLVFVILLALVLAVIENTRVLTASGYVSVAADAAMETVFGGYNKELFDEYHLLGYGGYSGKDLTELADDIESVVKFNLQTHPKDIKKRYSDLYRIEDLSCQAVNAKSIGTHEQFMNQISYYLSAEAIEDISGKILQKFKKNVEHVSKIDVSDELSKTEEYENGKYDSYFAGENGQVSDSDVERGKEKIDGCLVEDEAKGNPLAAMKEMVRDGLLSLVCDVTKISDVTVEKRENSEDAGNMKQSNSPYIEDVHENKELSDVEVSGYLETITESVENDGLMEVSGSAVDNGKAITYAQKVFSCYNNSSSSQSVHYGLEYLVAGNCSEKDNLLDVVTKILAVRMVCNFFYVIKNVVLLEKSLATAAVLVGFTGIEPLIKALQYTILLILAFEESCIDVSALLMGKSVPFVKNDTNFQMKYGEICKAGGNFFRSKAKAYKCLSGDKVSIKYTQFLWLFMMLVPTGKLESRIFDVIEYDLRSRYNNTFCLLTCFSKTDLDVTYQVPAMLSGIGKYGYDNRQYGKIMRRIKLSYAYTRGK